MSSHEQTPKSNWVARYGENHRWRRVDHFLPGIIPPQKVRLYQRTDHYLLNWWDPIAGKNLSERVDGDLVTALARARQIDERILAFRTGGVGKSRRISHADVVAKFIDDLTRRANAGEIGPRTVARYRSALDHYLEFCIQQNVAKTFPTASTINRDFRLELSAFLAGRQVHGNGRAGARLQPMKGQSFIFDTIRGMFEWAADPERGGLLPEGFRNPFLKMKNSRDIFRGDQLAAPDITPAMAVAFLESCDEFQFRLFVPMILFGLRAAEPCFLFREHFEMEWVLAPCIPDLGYSTKGRRDKRFPLIGELEPCWKLLRAGSPQGLLFERRSVVEGRETALNRGHSLDQLVNRYRHECTACQANDAAVRLRIRNKLLSNAGALNYDGIEEEFRAISQKLKWPRKATLKDFRHGFATMLGNSPMADAYKKYLMGHSPGRSALMAYTHLNQLREQFTNAIFQEWPALLETIRRKSEQILSARPAP